MKNKITVTIVIPTVNRADRVLIAINSLNDQKFDGKIKCVVVDSSDNDKTSKIISENSFSNKKLEVKYIKNKFSKRPIDNWLIGIEEFKSEFGKFLCDDDWLDPDFISKCLEILINKNVDCVISNISVVEENGFRVDNYYKTKTRLVDKNSVINSFLGIDNILPVTPTASLMRTNILIESFYESLKHIECTKNLFGFDFYMSYYPVFHGKGTYIFNDNLAFSYAGKDSMTLNVKKAKISYCYFFSLLNLIQSVDYKISSIQKKAIQHKLSTFNLKSLFSKEYRILKIHTSFKARLNIANLVEGQVKKYSILIKYFLKARK